MIAGKIDATWWFTPSVGLCAMLFGGATTGIGVRSAVFNQQIGVSVRL
jgi:hypothetical protein